VLSWFSVNPTVALFERRGCGSKAKVFEEQVTALRQQRPLERVGRTSCTPRREGGAGFLPYFFSRVTLAWRACAQPLFRLSCTDRLDDVENPALGLVMAQFESRNELANPGHIGGDGGDIVLHPIHVQDLQIGFQGTIAPP
jgi:hypothetical protein